MMQDEDLGPVRKNVFSQGIIRISQVNINYLNKFYLIFNIYLIFNRLYAIYSSIPLNFVPLYIVLCIINML